MQTITQDQIPSAIALLLQKVDDLTSEIRELKSGNTSETLVSVKELCSRLGVSERQIRRLVAERAIPYTRLGKRIVFDFEEVKNSFTIKVKK